MKDWNANGVHLSVESKGWYYSRGKHLNEMQRKESSLGDISAYGQLGRNARSPIISTPHVHTNRIPGLLGACTLLAQSPGCLGSFIKTALVCGKVLLAPLNHFCQVGLRALPLFVMTALLLALLMQD